MTRPQSARDRTRHDLYELVFDAPGITRTELAHLTKMSRSAVAQGVARLISEARISERDAEAGGPGTGSGRPASGLFPVASGRPVVGVDFGHNHVWVAIADGLGTFIADERRSVDVDLNAYAAMDLAAQILHELQRKTSISQVSGIVAGIPGPVDSQSGLVKSPTILSGWVGLAPAEELTARLGTPVHVENDAVLGAIGELHAGAGRSHKNFMYVKASNGVGAALIIDGKPFRGATGLAGEIGHTRLIDSNELCRCGDRGCLEAVVSLQAIKRQLLHTHPEAQSDDLDPSTFNDPVSDRIFGQAGRTIGQVLAASCNLVNPSAVIVGGELGTASPALIDGIRSAIEQTAQPATAAAVDIFRAELGSRAELVGAVRMAARYGAERR